jgi:hypothetical protein
MSVILEHWLPLGTDVAEPKAKEKPWLEQTVEAAKAFVNRR